MKKENASKLWKMIQEAGDYLVSIKLKFVFMIFFEIHSLF